MNAADEVIRVVIVDDSELVRAGLKSLLGRDPRLRIVGEAGDVAGAPDACARARADVVLLDIRLPDGNGFDACRKILASLPEARILMLTSVAEPDLIDESIRAGATGYLLKEINPRGLVQAILDAAAGKSILDPAVTAKVLQLVRSSGSSEKATLESLSNQERRVLALISEGRTNKEVGAVMNLSEKTVKNYLSNIFDKLHVSRRAHAAALYSQSKDSQKL